ncbi:hypothetical protein [Microbacterium sp. RURRCA19A]|uniref:hypothetical protein n=1 Tax=Microbacterium sp. RURRCA19A TaxID=1907391 RepID=UPI0009557568|nr:hypothetical protein [Microbacterium sp. RURRCA19A]SIS10621.1 hypothetical protein SAMN05880568_2803 [Microbacterium sp. RURRCA19A]
MPDVWNVVSQVLGGIVVGTALGLLLSWALGVLDDWHERREQRNQLAIEAELDRTQAELRRTILDLSAALGADAHEARKALIRESYLARGEIPKN